MPPRRSTGAVILSATVRYRPFGSTPLQVSELGFGGWGIGGQLWVPDENCEPRRALQAALDGGINFIDTALKYGHGHSERLIGEVLRERNERVYITTKVPPRNGAWPAQGAVREAFPGSHIRRCAELSLQNLQMDCLDVLLLHVWSAAWTHDNEWIDSLKELRREGKIRYFGVSVNDHQPDSALELVRSRRIDAIQVIYNIFAREAEQHLFPLCQDRGVGLIVRAPLDEGGLTGQVTPATTFPRKDWRNIYFRGTRKIEVARRVRALRPLLADETRSLAALALKFSLHPRAVTTVIPGMRSAAHVRENLLACQEAPLSRDALERLREHRWDRNFYPSRAPRPSRPR